MQTYFIIDCEAILSHNGNLAVSHAGVAQWQSGCFPSIIRGFDSLHPLQLHFTAAVPVVLPEASRKVILLPLWVLVPVVRPEASR